MRYGPLAALFFLSLAAKSAFALEWQLALTPSGETVSAQNPLEYEIATDPGFASKSLVDQDYSTTATLKGNLPPGSYYLRYRLAEAANSASREWSAPRELMITSTTETSFIEPSDQTKVESPTPKTAILFRWKPVAGATRYELSISSKGKVLEFKTHNPFLTTELPYGAWRAQVTVIFGKKVISTSQSVALTIEPNTQEGAEFVRPQNNDVIPAYRRTRLMLKRLYQAQYATLVIKAIDGQKHFETRDLSPSDEDVPLPALPPGRYQLTVTDQLNAQSSVDSNVVIRAEEDPLGEASRGSGTSLEAFLGPLFGSKFQANHTLGSNKVWAEDALRFGITARNDYFDPYGIELRAEAYKNRYRLHNLLSNYNTEDHLEQMFSLSLLYRTNLIPKPNSLFLRAGLFTKQYHQISDDFSAGFGSQQAVETPVRLAGLTVGADWLWQSWSTKWTARFSTRVMFPLLSMSQRVATGAPSLLSPALGFSATLKRYVHDYMYFTFGPEIVIERWINSEKDETLNKSEHNTAGWGLQLGLGMDI